MKLLPVFLLLCLTAFTVCGEPAPTPEKIDAFLNKLTASCKAGDIQGIKALSCFDGAGSGLVDQSVGFWETLLNDYVKTKGWTFKEARFVSLKDRLADPASNQSAIKWSIDPQVRNGHPYARNLPTAGFAIISFSMGGGGSGSNVFPVGIDEKGDLKFSEWKRTDAATQSAVMPASPSAAPAAPAPTQKQIDAFTGGLFAALQSGDPEACKAFFCLDGVPGELVDKELDQWKVIVLDFAKKRDGTFEKPAFTLLEDYLSKMGDGRQQAEAAFAPKVMNGTTYRPNLPIAGMAVVSIKFKQGGTSSERPVGVDANGALKFVLLRP